jgi:hypothetical protein
MNDLTRKFILETTRSTLGAITDVTGNLGNWPFRRVISYHIGVNCDAISVRDGHLYVHRRGRTIAIAELPQRLGPLKRLLQFLRNGLLHPRHARGHAGSTPQDIRWEDMLRSRRQK